MSFRCFSGSVFVSLSVTMACSLPSASRVVAQESLAQLPGYASLERVRSGVRGLGADGRVSRVDWSDDGAALTYRRQEKMYRVSLTDYSVAPMEQPEEPKAKDDRGGGPRRRRAAIARAGRAEQSTWVRSPNGQWIARYRDYNVILEKVTDRRRMTAAAEPKPPQAGGTEPAAGANDPKPAAA